MRENIFNYFNTKFFYGWIIVGLQILAFFQVAQASLILLVFLSAPLAETWKCQLLQSLLRMD